MMFLGMLLTPAQLRRARIMRRYGIVYPLRTIVAAKRAGLHLGLACAFLEQETSGGHNEFGHDPTIFVGAGEVTKAKYLAYKARRGSHGQGGMQGVGPMQLTYYSYQDEADAAGGCWKPYCNMLVGFRTAASHIRQSGEFAGVAEYNGSGPAAQEYARHVLVGKKTWTARLGL